MIAKNVTNYLKPRSLPDRMKTWPEKNLMMMMVMMMMMMTGEVKNLKLPYIMDMKAFVTTVYAHNGPKLEQFARRISLPWRI